MTRTVELEEVADVNPRFAAAIDASTAVTFVGMADLSADRAVTEAHESRPYSEVAKGYTPFENGDLLVAKITPCFENGKIGQARLKHRFGFGSTEFHVVRPDPEQADDRFLLHFLRSPRFRSQGQMRMTGSGGQRRVPADYVKKAKLNLPLLDEQKRIAVMLDKADELRAQRSRAIAGLDNLRRSIFHAMFGDPVRNERGWDSHPVSDFVSDATGGKNVVGSVDEDGGYRVLKISAITSLRFNPVETKPLPPGYVPPDRHLLRNGDLLFSRANTSELVGATVLIREAPEKYALPDKIWRLEFDPAFPTDPRFVETLFQHKAFRSKVSALASGSSGSMKNISKPKLFGIQVGMPPLGLQVAFGNQVEAAARLQDAGRTQLAELEALFASLQHRAFDGSL